MMLQATQIAQESIIESSFNRELDVIYLPYKLAPLQMVYYDGMTNPDQHIELYKQHMLTLIVPRQIKEACMCIGFGAMLPRLALQWFILLPNRSIDSFADLHLKFANHFASSRAIEKTPNDLYGTIQGSYEPLREYMWRFNKEKYPCLTVRGDSNIYLQERAEEGPGHIQRTDQDYSNHNGRGTFSCPRNAKVGGRRRLTRGIKESIPRE